MGRSLGVSSGRGWKLDRGPGGWPRRVRCRGKKWIGVFPKLLKAPVAAEVVGRPVVSIPAGRGVRLDVHPADRIFVSQPQPPREVGHDSASGPLRSSRWRNRFSESGSRCSPGERNPLAAGGSGCCWRASCWVPKDCCASAHPGPARSRPDGRREGLPPKHSLTRDGSCTRVSRGREFDSRRLHQSKSLLTNRTTRTQSEAPRNLLRSNPARLDPSGLAGRSRGGAGMNDPGTNIRSALQ